MASLRLLPLLLGVGCSKTIYLASEEGPCLADVHEAVTDAGIAIRGEACGEVLLRSEWDLDKDGTYDCRVDQFVPTEGVYVRKGWRWLPARPDAGCPPE